MAEPDGWRASEPAHIPALDGARGIAIILVLLGHFLRQPLMMMYIAPTAWLDRNVYRLVGAGWAGVDLFFVLSGFLITRILLSSREQENYFRNFYARRFLRIFPLYYGFLLFFIVVLPLVPGFMTVPWMHGFRNAGELAKLRHFQLEYWTYLTNVTHSLHPFADRGMYASVHLWSLAVEEQFYLVWPAVVLVLGRRHLAVFCLLCIITAPIIRYGLLHGAVPQLHNSYAPFKLTPARMDALAIGGLIAVAAGEPDRWRRALRWALPVGAASALVLVGLYLWRGGLNSLDSQVLVVGHSALALTFAAFLTMAVGGPPGALQAFCQHRVLTFFGKYSYGLYVVHFQIMIWLTHVVKTHGGMRPVFGSYLPDQLAFLAAATAISVAVAWLSWHLYENQFLKLKRFVPYGHA